MNQFDKYVLPTPAGAYYCIATAAMHPAKTFLQQLLLGDETLQLNKVRTDVYKTANVEVPDELLAHIISLEWLQEFDQTLVIPSGTMEDILPTLLKSLSSDGKALLADHQGFYLASAGFTHEASEELSALSGDLASLYGRHEGILRGNLNITSSAFSIVDAAGYSQLGFWPVYIGELQFVLIVSGVPRFDQAAFVDLVWYLHRHYFEHGEVDNDSDAA